jgi:hypothetical protein
MHFDQNSRLFSGQVGQILKDKSTKLAVVEIDCGPLGISTFRLSIKLSKRGHPVLRMRTIKPLTGEVKKRELMSVPILPSLVSATAEAEVDVPKKKKK